MKFTMSTIKFQDMVARASKGASHNKLLPITSMMAIELEDNNLQLVTTDSSNTLTIKADKIEGDNFYCVVPAEVFSRLIARTTSPNITLKLQDNSMEVIGNGVYNIALPMDEEGQVEFPTYEFDKKGEPAIINLTTVKNILNINKPALAINLDTPCLCGYYLGDKVITTDENVICFNDYNALGKEVLISPEMMELLSLSTEEKIKFYKDGSYLLFETKDMVLHGEEHPEKELYPVEEVGAYLQEDFISSCTLPKLYLESVIDRLSIFIEPYDKNGAYFLFTKEGLQLLSKRSSSKELIAYKESNNFKPFACCVDIPMLRAQIEAIPEETITMWYGHEAAIKLTSGKVTQVIALLEDEDMEQHIGK